MTHSRIHNVLMIAHDFPPSAGGGVQRAMKLARYLPDSGWRPWVLSATVVSGTPTDESLLEQVGHVEVRQLPDRNVAASVARLLPTRPTRSSRSQDAAAHTSRPRPRTGATGDPISTRVARHFYLDSAELWARSLPAAAKEWSAEIRFDAVLATGPPHSALIAGARVSRDIGVPYVVDLRDAWGSNPGYRWPDSHARDKRSRRLEQEVIDRADAVIAVSAPIAEEARALGAARTVVIPNGFDPADLPGWAPESGPLRVVLMGNFYASTDPTPFLEGAAAAVNRGGAAADLGIDVLGSPSGFLRNAIAALGLEAHVTYHGFKIHSEALGIASRSDFGLVALTDHPGAEANYTGKIFEFLGMGVPVLLVGPERGVAAELVREARGGVVVPYGDSAGVADALEHAAAEKIAGIRMHTPVAEVIQGYGRRAQANRAARVLDEVVGFHGR